MLFHGVSSRAGVSMSHEWHMKSGILFATRSSVSGNELQWRHRAPNCFVPS
jgi:hypothetical protein